MRYMGGTPSVPALYAARPGQEIILEIGTAAIREKSLRQTHRIMELADGMGLKINTPREDARRGGMVCIDFDGAETVSKQLLKRRFMLDYRPSCGIRVSPHYYTTDDEVEEMMAELRSLLPAEA
jgi:kynureninase